MKKTSKPVVFFGSGPVAAKSLELLVQDFEIEAVVTKPRAAHHKGDVPVLDVADKLGLKVYTADSRQSLDDLIDSDPFQADLAILIDFGIIVSQKVIDYFPLGIINSHFSLLPEWRGADPITFSVLSGQKRTGVSLMLLTAGMDEGPILAQTTLDLPQDITTPDLTDKLIEQSYRSLCDTLPLYLAGRAVPAAQSEVTLAPSITPTYSRKLTKEDGLLDWSKPAKQLEREIRAFIEWPKSRVRLRDLDIVITKAHVVDEAGAQPGTWVARGKQLIVSCGEDALAIDLLKPAGKKEMTGEAFLAGYRKLLN